jgi:nicotinic acid phosphoribosyltransferase
MTDSYKLTHWRIYPKRLTKMRSYLEARSPSDFADETVFFGLQYFIKRYLLGTVITTRDLPRLRAFCKHHFYGVEGLFNEEGWRYIIEKHNGRLPVSIKAVAEGTVVPVGNVMMTIENTDENCAWLTNFLETVLVEVWNTITVASLSRAMKKNQYAAMKKTVEDELIPIILPSRVHDFGYRGVSSPETAALSAAAAHLVNFAGTDTIAGIELINQFYSNDGYSDTEEYDMTSGDEWNSEESYRRWDRFYADHMPGFSIPATEHSQMTLGGPEGELSVCRNLISEFPNGFVACVSDSYDLFNCVNEYWDGALKDDVLNRNGTLVVRPDSGDPIKIVPMVLEAQKDDSVKELGNSLIFAFTGFAIIACAAAFASAFGVGTLSGGPVTQVHPITLTGGIKSVADFIIMMSAGIFILIVVIAGLGMIASQGESSNFDKWRKVLVANCIGVVLMLTSYFIIHAISDVNSGLLITEMKGLALWMLTLIGYICVAALIVAGIMLIVSIDDGLKDRAKRIVYGTLISLLIVIACYSLIVIFIPTT